MPSVAQRCLIHGRWLPSEAKQQMGQSDHQHQSEADYARSIAAGHPIQNSDTSADGTPEPRNISHYRRNSRGGGLRMRLRSGGFRRVLNPGREALIPAMILACLALGLPAQLSAGAVADETAAASTKGVFTADLAYQETDEVLVTRPVDFKLRTNPFQKEPALPGQKVLRGDAQWVTSTRQHLKHIYLSFRDIDWSRTRAYSVGYCGPIYINLKGREPHGIVEPGNEYEAVLNQIAADLATLKEPGKDSPLFPEIHMGRDVYWGPHATEGPDLLFFPENWKYVAVGLTSFNDTSPFAPSGLKTGTHRPDGILFLSGPGIKKGQQISGATLMDIAPTALALLGVPVPEPMDGHVLETVMTPELLRRLDIDYTDDKTPEPQLVPVAEMSAEDEAILIARLRDLGYIT